MARIKRKQIEISENGVRDLAQEIYNDAHQIRSTIIALFNNWNSKVKEQGEIAAMGKEIVNLINALARNQDQKINLMKVLSDILYTKDKNAAGKIVGKSDGSDNKLDDTTKNQIREMIEQARERGEIDI